MHRYTSVVRLVSTKVVNLTTNNSYTEAQVTKVPVLLDPRQITSTYYVTSVITIISCSSAVENCPGSSTSVITTSDLVTSTFSPTPVTSTSETTPTDYPTYDTPSPSSTEDYPTYDTPPPTDTETYCQTKFIDHYHTIQIPITVEKTIYVPETDYETITQVTTDYETITEVCLLEFFHAQALSNSQSD